MKATTTVCLHSSSKFWGRSGLCVVNSRGAITDGTVACCPSPLNTIALPPPFSLPPPGGARRAPPSRRTCATRSRPRDWTRRSRYVREWGGEAVPPPGRATATSGAAALLYGEGRFLPGRPGRVHATLDRSRGRNGRSMLSNLFLDRVVQDPHRMRPPLCPPPSQ